MGQTWMERFDRLRMPRVQVHAGDDETAHWMLLDTGNNGPILLRPARFDINDGVLSGSSGIYEKNQRMLRTELPRIRIGPYVLADVPVAVPISGQHNLNEGGILGYAVLRHVVVTADFLKGRVHQGVPDNP